MTQPFLFSTGIENSYPTIQSGTRIDQMAKSGYIAPAASEPELEAKRA